MSMNKSFKMPQIFSRPVFKRATNICLPIAMLTVFYPVLAQTLVSASTPVSIPVNNKNFRVERKIDKALLEKFDAAIKANPSISGIEFDGVMDAPEIDVDAVMGLHGRIKQYQLSTAARGLCVGSCALLFMSGYTRTMLPAGNNRLTRVALRPLTNQYHEFLYEQTDMLVAEIIKRSDGKITGEFMAKIYLVRDDVASLMIQYLAGKSDINVIFLERAGGKVQPVEPSTAEGLGLKIGA
ncbi:hypothetical protein UNDYM_1696 [Undibacterium sp. YM2]|uniref:hypothetical protein n=1 Tax=Undibacterium sp. YM2 TaxID=2058625 RepID=UPI001331E2FD|nr:hypothetical protein [Undibacterium sp. YM2]BBB65949.1 hypothetical protein UNDYM_1696 [Undibacterium sp. YM2]